MPFVLVRALACYLLLGLVLPPGWCCHVGSRDCCSKECTSKEAAPAKKSCCCRDEAAPAGPDTPPSPKPRSDKCWCCERQPSVAPGKDKVTFDLAFPGPEVVTAVVPTAEGAIDPPCPESPSRSLPLHLLKCVWLC